MRKTFPHQAEVIDILRSLYEDHEGGQNIQLHCDINDWIDEHLPEYIAEQKNWDYWREQDWKTVYDYLVSIGQIKLQNVWMAVWKGGEERWQNCEQILLENVSWKQAVQTAKSQSYPTRLSVTVGFDNQGHYFHPA